MEILAAIIITAFLAFTHVLAHGLGRLDERSDALRRSMRANEIFFERVKDVQVPTWRTSSDLLGYVAGVEDEPENPTYQSLTPS